MGQIQGSLQNIQINLDGTFKTLVCLSNSSVATTVDTSTDQTNCGSFTSPGNPSMAIDFDAVCESMPTITQVSYTELLAAIANKTQITVKVESPSSAGLAEGEVYYHEFNAYLTALTLTQSTSEFIKFSGSIASTGTLTVIF